MGGMAVPRSDRIELHKGDILTVTGPAAGIDLLGEALGHAEREVPDTDMLTFSAGVAVGLFTVQIGGVSVGLGTAGGLVATGIVIGFLRSIYPTFGRLPEAVRWIFMEFGLLLFMAGVGLRAGGDIILETAVGRGAECVVFFAWQGTTTSNSPLLRGVVTQPGGK